MVELADIVCQAGPAYRRAFEARMLPSHRRALEDLCACRTPELGGSLFACDAGCGHLDFAYHSCRNRHCPKCHRDDTRRWLEGLRTRLLPCRYYLVTFTLPAELRALARSHQRIVYDLLLRAAAAALQTLADDPRWMGATLGILAVLHTWARDLSYHPHVHLLVTAGGLTPDGEAWRKPAHRRLLVPGYCLSPIFRAKMRDGLDAAGLSDELDAAIFRKPWAVHLQHVGDGRHAAEYLSRYVHRVALTNERIEVFDGERVTFRYVCSRSRETRRLTLPVHAFLARFLQHVLPKGFHKIRAYGLLSPAAGRRREQARELLEREEAALHAARAAPRASPRRKRPCPSCRRGHLQRVRSWHRPSPELDAVLSLLPGSTTLKTGSIPSPRASLVRAPARTQDPSISAPRMGLPSALQPAHPRRFPTHKPVGPFLADHETSLPTPVLLPPRRSPNSASVGFSTAPDPPGPPRPALLLGHGCQRPSRVALSTVTGPHFRADPSEASARPGSSCAGAGRQR